MQQKKKTALEALAPKGMQQRARASRATTQGGHAAETSSDQSDDESSELSTIVAHTGTYASDSDSQTSRSGRRSSSSCSSAYSYM